MTSYRPVLTLSLCGALAAVVHGSLRAEAAPSAAEALAEVIEVDLTWLTTLEWEPGRELPEAVRALDGRTAVIRGYMHASVQDDVKTFPMVSEGASAPGA